VAGVEELQNGGADDDVDACAEAAELHEPMEILPSPSEKKAPSFIVEGSILKAVLKLAWPMWIAVVLQDAYNLVDLFWVGKLGKEPVAAVALCGILMGMVFTVAIGLATGVVALVARFMGAGRPERAWAATWQALYMGIGAGLLTTVIGLPLARPALAILGARGDILALGASYLQVMAVGAGTIFVVFSMNSAFRGAGDTVTPMIAMGIGTIVNLILDPFLIFGWWIFPALEVAGSALATVCAQTTSLLFLIGMLALRDKVLRLRLREARPDPTLMWRIARVGIFGSMQMWVRNVSSLFVISIVTPFGPSVLAAFGICVRLLMVFLLPGFGVGNAAATLVGQNLGAGKPERGARSGWTGSGVYAAFSLVFGGVFFLLAPDIVAVFNDSPAVVMHGSLFLRILSVSFPFTALGVVLGRAMAGAGDTLAPMRITALALLLVQVPAAFGLSRFFGPLGIWLSFSMANVVNGILMAVWFHQGRWAKKRV